MMLIIQKIFVDLYRKIDLKNDSYPEVTLEEIRRKNGLNSCCRQEVAEPHSPPNKKNIE